MEKINNFSTIVDIESSWVRIWPNLTEIIFAVCVCVCMCVFGMEMGNPKFCKYYLKNAQNWYFFKKSRRLPSLHSVFFFFSLFKYVIKLLHTLANVLLRQRTKNYTSWYLESSIQRTWVCANSKWQWWTRKLSMQ